MDQTERATTPDGRGFLVVWHCHFLKVDGDNMYPICRLRSIFATTIRHGHVSPLSQRLSLRPGPQSWRAEKHTLVPIPSDRFSTLNALLRTYSTSRASTLGAAHTAHHGHEFAPRRLGNALARAPPNSAAHRARRALLETAFVCSVPHVITEPALPLPGILRAFEASGRR